MRTGILLSMIAAMAAAQTSAPASASTPASTPASVPDSANDPAYASLTIAFDALRVHDYDRAILLFRQAVSLSPHRTDIRKNLAYTFLKTGDSDSAREEFGEAMRNDPSDFHVALEYAFLCYEARDDASARKAEARRIFATLRDTGDPVSRATAAAAFRNIEEPLRTGIERWQHVLATSPPTFDAHYELAQLAEQRDETELAATHYKAAFQLQPDRKSVLLDLARVQKARGNAEGMMAALLAASRGPEPRAAELARERLPARYPHVYEFRQALELDPSNDALHKELAYLLLRMSETGLVQREDAEKEFAALNAVASSEDYTSEAQLGLLYLADHLRDQAMPLLNRVLARGPDAIANRVRMALNIPLVLMDHNRSPETVPHPVDPPALDPRLLGERSYQAGFMKDALRYFTQAHEQHPLDSSVVLKLGWTNNMLHDDVTALRWFNVARQSGDPAVAAEAQRAWRNLQPEQQRLRTTVWLYPLYSSRWSDLFGYGQLKTEVKAKGLPLHSYASIRLMGDARRSTGGPLPQSLSESAFIGAVGVASDNWYGATAWFEAGIAASYLTGNHWNDYRGGISYSRTRGASLTGERPGSFLETTADSVYISHFNEDFINYVQTRLGYTSALAGSHAQVFWNQILTFDAKRQYWANFFETGPGFRIHPPGVPLPVWIDISALRGAYLCNEGNPGRPNFNDVRVGLWYAFTR